MVRRGIDLQPVLGDEVGELRRQERAHPQLAVADSQAVPLPAWVRVAHQLDACMVQQQALLRICKKLPAAAAITRQQQAR